MADGCDCTYFSISPTWLVSGAKYFTKYNWGINFIFIFVLIGHVSSSVVSWRPGLCQKIALPTWPPFCRVGLQLNTLAIRVCAPILGVGVAGRDRFSLEEA